MKQIKEVFEKKHILLRPENGAVRTDKTGEIGNAYGLFYQTLGSGAARSGRPVRLHPGSNTHKDWPKNPLWILCRKTRLKDTSIEDTCIKDTCIEDACYILLSGQEIIFEAKTEDGFIRHLEEWGL